MITLKKLAALLLVLTSLVAPCQAGTAGGNASLERYLARLSPHERAEFDQMTPAHRTEWLEALIAREKSRADAGGIFAGVASLTNATLTAGAMVIAGAVVMMLAPVGMPVCVAIVAGAVLLPSAIAVIKGLFDRHCANEEADRYYSTNVESTREREALAALKGPSMLSVQGE